MPSFGCAGTCLLQTFHSGPDFRAEPPSLSQPWPSGQVISLTRSFSPDMKSLAVTHAQQTLCLTHESNCLSCFKLTECAVLRREELQEFDAFDEGVFCRSRTWLFLSYVVSFGAVAGSVWVLMQVWAPVCPLQPHSPASNLTGSVIAAILTIHKPQPAHCIFVCAKGHDLSSHGMVRVQSCALCAQCDCFVRGRTMR